MRKNELHDGWELVGHPHVPTHALHVEAQVKKLGYALLDARRASMVDHRQWSQSVFGEEREGRGDKYMGDARSMSAHLNSK